MFDENVATIILSFFAPLNRLSKEAPTVFSLKVIPVRSAFVESDSNAKTPFLPSSEIHAISIISPLIGVESNLKSPVIKIVPTGVFIANATASGME